MPLSASKRPTMAPVPGSATTICLPVSEAIHSRPLRTTMPLVDAGGVWSARGHGSAPARRRSAGVGSAVAVPPGPPQAGPVVVVVVVDDGGSVIVVVVVPPGPWVVVGLGPGRP